MPVTLHDKCRKALVDKLAAHLAAYTIRHGLFLQNSLGRFAGEQTIPKAYYEQLQQWVTETPVADFVEETIAQDMLDSASYAEAERPVPLTQLPRYKDPEAAAGHLASQLESLPWEYTITATLNSDVSQQLSSLLPDLALTDPMRLVKPTAEFEKAFPLTSGIELRDQRLSPSMPLPFWLGGSQPVPKQWEKSSFYVQVNVRGFIGPYAETAALHQATSVLKSFLGLGIAFRLFTLQLRPHIIQYPAQLLIHRRVGEKWIIENNKHISQGLSKALAELSLDTTPMPFVVDPHRWAKMCINLMNAVFAKPDVARKTLLAAQWFLDSYCTIDDLLAFVQATVAMEILLGDKAESEKVGITELLSSRCAYLIASGQGERTKLISEFKEIYDVRSKIVHAGKTRLDKHERELLWNLQVMCGRALEREAQLLKADADSEAALRLTFPLSLPTG